MDRLNTIVGILLVRTAETQPDSVSLQLIT